MPKVAITGTITRIVDVDGPAPRVFFKPSDASVYKTLDGSKFCATGEIAVAAPENVAELNVGDPFSAEV